MFLGTKAFHIVATIAGQDLASQGAYCIFTLSSVAVLWFTGCSVAPALEAPGRTRI